jgi:hypothetical protein
MIEFKFLIAASRLPTIYGRHVSAMTRRTVLLNRGGPEGNVVEVISRCGIKQTLRASHIHVCRSSRSSR